MTRSPARRPLTAAVASGATLAVVTALLSPVATEASWTESEWDTATVTTLDCAVAEGLESRAGGRILTGELLGASLDPVVSLDGVTAFNDGAVSTGSPASATLVAPHTYRNAIGLGAIADLIHLDLGLALPLEFGTGAYAQHGQARPDGTSTGASGVVTDGGAVDLDAIEDGSAPDVGTLRLSDLPGLGAALGPITDLELEIGAVGASATVDGCQTAWTGESEATLQRAYGVAGLDLDVESPAVRAVDEGLSGALDDLLVSLGSTVTAVEAALSTVVKDGLGGILNGLLDNPLLSLGRIDPTVEITLDPTPVLTVLTAPLTDGAITVDLTRGRIGVDLAALLGDLHEDSDGLNGRAPNTPVLSADVLTAIVQRVAKLLRDPVAETGLLYDLEAALDRMILDAEVAIIVDAKIAADLGLLGTLNVVDIDLGITTSVGGLLGYPDHTPPDPDVKVALLNSGLLGLLLAPVNALVNLLLGGLKGLVSEILVPLIAGTLQTLLLQPADALIGSVLDTAVGIVTTLVDVLGPALGLVGQLVSITLNSQPDRPPYPDAPGTALPGEYIVSALRIGVLDGPGAGAASLLNLFLATARVGPNVR